MKTLYQNSIVCLGIFALLFVMFFQLPETWVNHNIYAGTDLSFYTVFTFVFIEVGYLVFYPSLKNKTFANVYLLFMNFLLLFYLIYLLLNSL